MGGDLTKGPMGGQPGEGDFIRQQRKVGLPKLLTAHLS